MEFTDEMRAHQKLRFCKGGFAMPSHDTEPACCTLITVWRILPCEYWSRVGFGCASWVILFLAMLAAQLCAQQSAQTASPDVPSSVGARSTTEPTTKPGSQINVNWFYGSYIPKDVPLQPLSGDQRLQLYVRQTYTTWGIYIKTMLFTVHDQIHDKNPEWDGGAGGFVKRLGTRQAQFVIQNSVTSLGDGVVGWEPRYDRCRCDGFWPRTRHAIVRNFITYGGDDRSLRPQLMPYVGAFAGGAVASTWEPGNQQWWTAGYQAAAAQILIGIGSTWIGEFAPEISSKLHRKK